MSNQYPGQPGQPGDLPPTQVAPGAGGPPQQPGPPQGYPPQPGAPQGYPQQPPAPYGAPGGGGGFPPPQYGAPPTGGGKGKRVGLILAIVGIVVLLLIGTAVALFFVLGDDDDDDPKKKVTVTRTAESSDVSTPPTTDVTTPTTDLTTDVTTDTTTEAGGPSSEDAEITAAAYLNSLVEGNCLAVEGLSTPEWFSSQYGSQRACKRAAGNAQMADVQYEFEAPVDNGDGTVTLVANVSDADEAYTATWILTPAPDNADWLVDSFELV